MAEPITKLEDLSANVRSVIEANAGNELIPVKRDASGVITEYRQMSPQEYLSSKGGITRAGYFGNDVAEGRGMSDEQYFGLLKKGGVSALNKFNEDRLRASETQKLIARYTSQGLSAADAATKAAKFFANADEALANGGTVDADGNIIYGDGSSLSSTSSNSLTMGTDPKREERISAYNLLYEEFDKYGLGSLVSDIKNILVEGSLDPAEFSLKVRGTDAYKARFIANEARLAKGLKALSPAQYIALEDQYQEVMRQYGLPETYYAKTSTGVQEGFRKLIENDVSNIELEDRISTAQKRVLNANPEVTQAIRQFYPDITNADILAYTLDPKNAIENIKRKVTTAEIGGAALQAGLQTGLTRAEQLRAAGVTKETAQQGYGTIAGGLPRGSQLASIYGEDPYTQTTAETEVFNIAGAQEARKQRQKITGLEKATFGGQSGISSGALARDRAGAY